MAYRVLALSLYLHSLVYVINGEVQLTYQDLIDLKASCGPDDSCKEKRIDSRDNMLYYRCECKASCVEHDTCCIDSPYINPMRQATLRKKNKGTCQYPFRSTDGTYVVSSCDPKWTGHPLAKAMCQNPSQNLMDPIAVLPVTSVRTKTTYQNYFCAFCNFETKQLRFWEIRVEGLDMEDFYGKSDADTLFKNLVYDRNMDAWGVYAPPGYKWEGFIQVNIKFQEPSDLRHIIPTCYPDIVSECAEGWTDGDNRNKCESYMARIFLFSLHGESKYYRNIHCVMCHNKTYLPSNVCQVKITSYGGAGSPFTILLNVNPSGGNTVGKIEAPAENECSEGKLYDGFHKECRELTCLFNDYVRKGDECVHISEI